MVKFASFLIFMVAQKIRQQLLISKVRSNSTAKKEGLCHRNQLLVNLYNNSSVKSLHIHLGNLTSVVHI